MCVRPIAIKSSKTGKVNLVPCGKCIECRKAFQTEWIFRLSQEMKNVTIPCFVTLTYNDEHVLYGDTPQGPQTVLLKSDVQLFLKRLRKHGKEVTKGLKYFAVGEYGTKNTNRAHYHLVLMAPNCPSVAVMDALVKRAWCDHDGNPIGFSYTKFCTKQQVHYVCKYMNKLDRRKHLEPPFRLYSRGLGLCYLTAAVVKHYLSTFDKHCVNGSCTIALPRYFRRKLDEISMENPFMKRAGVVYSELIPQPVYKEGSRYALFNELQKKLQKLADLQEQFYNSDFELAIPHIQVHFNQMFQDMCDRIPTLALAVYESQRILSDICIRNHLNHLCDITDYSFAFKET